MEGFEEGLVLLIVEGKSSLEFSPDSSSICFSFFICKIKFLAKAINALWLTEDISPCKTLLPSKTCLLYT